MTIVLFKNLILKLENMVSQLLILERRGERRKKQSRREGGNPLQPRPQVQPGPLGQEAARPLWSPPQLLNQLPLVLEPRWTQRPEASGNDLILSNAPLIENDTFPAKSSNGRKERPLEINIQQKPAWWCPQWIQNYTSDHQWYQSKVANSTSRLSIPWRQWMDTKSKSFKLLL